MSEHRLCATHDLEPGQARRFEVGTHKIALVRIDEEFHAIGDTCSHADVSLSEGEVHTATCELECYQHGSTFSLTTGEPATLPATQPVPVYPVTVRDGDVFVEVDG